jgi:putative transposase
MAARNPLAAITPIDDGARIHAWGEVWRLVKTTPKGHKLKHVHNTDLTVIITHSDYNAETLKSTFKYESDYFRPRKVVERARRHQISISDLPINEQDNVGFKIRCITEFYSLYHSKNISRTAEGYNQAGQPPLKWSALWYGF